LAQPDIFYAILSAYERGTCTAKLQQTGGGKSVFYRLDGFIVRSPLE